MLIKTNELSSAALDWAVAMAVGLVATGERVINGPILVSDEVNDLQREFEPSASWEHGGPLLDKFHIALDWNTCNDDDPGYDREPWMAACGQHLTSYGPTALIATCRAIVAAKLGDEVEVPDELLSTP